MKATVLQFIIIIIIIIDHPIYNITKQSFELNSITR